MKNLNPKTRLVIRLTGVALILCLFLLNSRYYVNLSSTKGDLSISTLRAEADGGEGAGVWIPITTYTQSTTSCANCVCSYVQTARTTCTSGGKSTCSPGTQVTNITFSDPQCH